MHLFFVESKITIWQLCGNVHVTFGLTAVVNGTLEPGLLNFAWTDSKDSYNSGSP
jgi:hypothetical protein